MPLFSRVCPIVALCTLGCAASDELAGEPSTTDGASTTDSPDAGSSTTEEEAGTSGWLTTTSGGSPTTSGSPTTDASTGSSSGDVNEDVPPPPEAPGLALTYAATKQFQFTWSPSAGAEYYQLLERPDSDAPAWSQLSGDLFETSSSWTMPLHLRAEASYALRACNSNGCSESEAVEVEHTVNSAIGYIKASNAESHDGFGTSVAMSADGTILVVGAPGEASGAKGVNGDQTDNGSWWSGAVYVFVQTGSTWVQEAYLKSHHGSGQDHFGATVAISADGNTVAIGATGDDSAATGVGGEWDDDSAPDSGAVHVYARKGGAWGHQAYVKAPDTKKSDKFGVALALAADGDTLVVGAPVPDAVHVYRRKNDTWSHSAALAASNADTSDQFGAAVALSGDGSTLAVGAPGEKSAAAGIDGDPFDDSLTSAGAVYLFGQVEGSWTQQTYVKPSNPDGWDFFGGSVALSFDGGTLAVGAAGESSGSAEIDGDQTDDESHNAGAVYVFSRPGGSWAQEAYIKAPNSVAFERFGTAVALSKSGDMLVAGAPREGGGGGGVVADMFLKSRPESGAAYVFVRSGGVWTHKSYVKAPNRDLYDLFGESLALAADGLTLAVGAACEQSLATGVGGYQGDDSGVVVGAVYVY